uniref:Uncharacterized protein n=1 Tax=Romanomermis culicivorax TaxID=13658 RepID=A0A915IXQ9_ROMCU
CLKFLNDEQIGSLISCLDASFTIAVEFDCRPGLKFLIQKVFSSPVCANLYKNLVTCWTYQISTFYTLSKDIFIAKSQPLWKAPPSDKCLQSYHDLSNVTIAFDGLVKNDIPRSLWYARALSLRYARVCSLICRLEHRQDDILHCSIDNAAPILEFLRAGVQNEGSPIVLRSRKNQTDSSSSTSFETDVEELEKLTNETEEKSQEQVYTLASNDYIENCLKG